MLKRHSKMLTYIVILGLMAFFIGNRTIVAKNQTDIVKMVELLQKDESLELGNWSVYARERTQEISTKQEFEREVIALKQRYPKFSWHQKQESAALEAVGTYIQAETGVSESIKILAKADEWQQGAYVIYEVKGKTWTKGQTAYFETTYRNVINDIFRGSPTIFSCIRGSFNDNMDSVLDTKIASLLELFHAREIESVHETNFTSVSAHTSLFKQPLTKEKLNLQLGLRTEGLGDRTNFVVGTPIITFEY